MRNWCRVGRDDEVTGRIAWLTSDKVSFSTGAVYDISGDRATYEKEPP